MTPIFKRQTRQRRQSK